MAKRRRPGRKPKGEYTGKREVVSVRLTPETKERLVAAAAASGRSASQEFEHRLRRTFNEDDAAVLVYGDRKTEALMQLLGSVVKTLVNLRDPKAEWHSDPYLYGQACEAIAAALELFKPQGAVPESIDDLLELGGRAQGRLKILLAAEDMQVSNPAAAMAKTTKHQRAMARLRDDLGDLADRPQLFGRTAKETRDLHDLGREFGRLMRKAEKLSKGEWRELRRLAGRIERLTTTKEEPR